MSARKRKTSPFSLFSFQDIVTSVTAVIILMTLILMLELITRKARSGAAQFQQSVTELRAALEEAEQQRRDLEQRLHQGTDQAEQLAASLPQTLTRDLQNSREQIARLKSELESIRQREQATKSQEDAALARSLDRDSARKELEALESKVKAAEKEIKDIKSEDRLIYNPASGIAKRQWLVDVTARYVRVIAMSGAQQHYDFEAGLLSSSANQFLAWVGKDCTAQGDYFLLLIRPSGIQSHEQIRDQLRTRNFDIGIDLIGSTQKVQAGRRGDASK